jgi:spore cortex biosynthesis protein YabQ
MSLSVQFETMMAMAIMGIWIGASIDTYGRFFPRRRKGNFLRIVSDIFFWILQGLIVFSVLLEVNRGEVRIYIFLALFCGYAAYQGLFRSFYVRILDLLIRAVLAFVRFIKKTLNLLLFQPVKMLLQLIYSLGKILGKVLLALFLFIMTVVWTPIKWLIPEAVLRQLKKTGAVFKNKEGFLQSAKNFKNRLKKWFRKRRE